MRIGHGYDVHRFKTGRKLIIGGVEIPYEMGLDGHSDADVLAHAVCDAILGALASGDIGRHFPDDDDKFLGANSIELLKSCTAMMREKGYRLLNLDCTIIAQKPKLSPYIQSMAEKIALATDSDKSQVNIKATTEEGLGFTGQMLGIAAHCVCLLQHEK